MPDTPHSPATPPQEPPSGLQPVDWARASRSHATDPREGTDDGAMPESDSDADSPGPTPIEYARHFAMLSDAVLTGVVPPSQAQAAATCLRHSFDVLHTRAPDRTKASSAIDASSEQTKPEDTGTRGPRTADTDQMRTIIDVFLEHAPDAFPLIDSMLTDADRGYARDRFTPASPQDSSR